MGNMFKYNFQKSQFWNCLLNKKFNVSHYLLYTIWHLRSCTWGYISCMTKSPTPLPLTPPRWVMHNLIVDDSWYGLSVCVLEGRGGGEFFWNFNCLKKVVLYAFPWTEEGLAFLDWSMTEMPGTRTQRLQVQKMVIKSCTSFCEGPFNNTTHYHVLKIKWQSFNYFSVIVVYW